MNILIRYAVYYRVNSTLTPSHDERICSVILQLFGIAVMLWSYARDNRLEVFPVMINPWKTKRRLFYLKSHSVPRSKHFSSRL